MEPSETGSKQNGEEIPANPITPEEQLAWCYVLLRKTSRSFAAVIQTLGNELKDAVCIFYLALRALDTIEDDTTFPKEPKLPLLINFHTFLYKQGWNYKNVGELDEKTLVENFNIVIEVFLRLKPEYQEVIADITKRMGKGMSEFIQREVVTLEDWDLYCHYVAGLVGIGLSKLFAASGSESSEFRYADKISNSMGLFLQKTNIIRDYLEDVNQDRIFWPREIWSKYADKLEDFKDPKNSVAAVQCLNHLITNATQHIPDCLEYMSMLKDNDTFNFCSIPQIMAIATLALCYNNHDVFTSVVKMKREETEMIIASMNGQQSLYHWFYSFINNMIAKVPFGDPNREKIMGHLVESRRLIEEAVGNAQPLSKL